jgi:hypothetical protein
MTGKIIIELAVAITIMEQGLMSQKHPLNHQLGCHL